MTPSRFFILQLTVLCLPALSLPLAWRKDLTKTAGEQICSGMAVNQLEFLDANVNVAVYLNPQKIGPINLSEVKKLAEEGKTDEQTRKDLAASFQAAVVEVLVAKLMRAFEQNPNVKEIHLAGGVSANRLLRAAIKEEAEEKKIQFRIPKSMRFCTDNAAMIAGAGYFLWKKEGPFEASNITPDSSFRLGE